MVPARWTIHLGAHKTGTTFLQANLEASRVELHRDGLDLLLPDQLRALDPRPLEGRGRVRRRLDRARADDLVGPVGRLLRGAPEVLLSEENLLGSAGQVIRGSFYDERRAAPRAIHDLTRRADVAIVLTIRRLDEFLPSAYSQMLQNAAAPPGRFPAVIDRSRRRPPSWSSVVRRLRKRVPRASIIVCMYEDLRGNEAEMLAVLTGGRTVPLRVTEIPNATRAATAEGVREAEVVDPSVDHDERVQLVRGIYDRHAAGGPFAPFPDDVVDLLRDRYERDVEEISALDDVDLRRLGR